MLTVLLELVGLVAVGIGWLYAASRWPVVGVITFVALLGVLRWVLQSIP